MLQSKEINALGIEKLAKVYTKLLPHQERVLKRMQEQPGLVVAHGLGTGKTLASIATADALKGKTEVVLPASLADNYAKEIRKHTKGSFNPNIVSMQKAVLEGKLDPADLLIVDEAHRAREPSTKLNDLLAHAVAKKRMLLTATPLYNRPADIAALVNLAVGKKILPEAEEFKKRYIEEPQKGLLGLMPWNPKKPTLKKKEELGSILRHWVDYQAPIGDFPSKKEETIPVEMSKAQTNIHDYAWDKLPLLMRIRLRMGLSPEKKDIPKLNVFESQTRQVSGSTKAFQKGDAPAAELTPKMQRATGDLASALEKDPAHKALVYSNYLNNLADYAKVLERQGVPFRIFTGKESKKTKDQAVRDYNAGLAKVLLVSSAGGEGLDLKGTRQVQVLEPHWNEEKLEQVIGRAIRHGSHSHLPEDQRNVAVQRYETYPRPGLLRRLFGSKPEGVEQVLSRMSKNKKELNQSVIDLLKPRAR